MDGQDTKRTLLGKWKAKVTPRCVKIPSALCLVNGRSRYQAHCAWQMEGKSDPQMRQETKRTVLDKWRAKVFTGETSPEELNNSWWELREFYQGIGVPRDRGADAFDPGAKYHIPGNTPYTRYYLARIMQYQFHESLCNGMGFDGPLHECSIYGNEYAGEKIISTMAMGQSAPWQDAFENLTGTRKLSGSSIVNYYEPLKEWLDAKNENRICGWSE